MRKNLQSSTRDELNEMHENEPEGKCQNVVKIQAASPFPLSLSSFLRIPISAIHMQHWGEGGGGGEGGMRGRGGGMGGGEG